jgi:hypothetical protein
MNQAAFWSQHWRKFIRRVPSFLSTIAFVEVPFRCRNATAKGTSHFYKLFTKAKKVGTKTATNNGYSDKQNFSSMRYAVYPHRRVD